MPRRPEHGGRIDLCAKFATTNVAPIINLVIHETHWVQVVEWYHPWANLAPTLTQYMDEQDVVLVCGCGNSEMSADMYDDGEGFWFIV